MTDEQKAPTGNLPWYPILTPCPRCNQGLRAHGTPTFSRLTLIQCRKCGWKIDVEMERKQVKETAIPPTEDTGAEELLDGPHPDILN